MSVKTNNFISFFVIFISAMFSLTAQQNPSGFLGSPNAYLGQKPPTGAAVKFNLPVSSGAFAIDRIAVSSDGKNIYFTEILGEQPTVKCVKFVDGKWRDPITLFAGFSSPALSPDGTTLYFQNLSKTCWYSKREGAGWGAPIRLTDKAVLQHYPQVTNSGQIFVASTPVFGRKADVSKLTLVSGDVTVQSLGAPVNSVNNGFDFYIARDESYVIVILLNVGFGAGDQYISFNKNDGGWTVPVNLGPSINSSEWEYGPYVSPDGKYIFFTRDEERAVFWARIDTVLNNLKKEQ